MDGVPSTRMEVGCRGRRVGRRVAGGRIVRTGKKADSLSSDPELTTSSHTRTTEAQAYTHIQAYTDAYI